MQSDLPWRVVSEGLESGTITEMSDKVKVFDPSTVYSNKAESVIDVKNLVPEVKNGKTIEINEAGPKALRS